MHDDYVMDFELISADIIQNCLSQGQWEIYRENVSSEELCCIPFSKVYSNGKEYIFIMEREQYNGNGIYCKDEIFLDHSKSPKFFSGKTFSSDELNFVQIIQKNELAVLKKNHSMKRILESEYDDEYYEIDDGRYLEFFAWGTGNLFMNKKDFCVMQSLFE